MASSCDIKLENPWLTVWPRWEEAILAKNLTDSQSMEFVHPGDMVVVEEHGKHTITPQYLPKPFQGDVLNCKVLLLMGRCRSAGPGKAGNGDLIQADEAKWMPVYRANLLQEPIPDSNSIPFISLVKLDDEGNPFDRANYGSNLWFDMCKTLLQGLMERGLSEGEAHKMLCEGLAAVQIQPYLAKDNEDPKELIRSLATARYAHQLAQRAIDNGALLVVGVRETQWVDKERGAKLHFPPFFMRLRKHGFMLPLSANTVEPCTVSTPRRAANAAKKNWNIENGIWGFEAVIATLIRGRPAWAEKVAELMDKQPRVQAGPSVRRLHLLGPDSSVQHHPLSPLDSNEGESGRRAQLACKKARQAAPAKKRARNFVGESSAMGARQARNGASACSPPSSKRAEPGAPQTPYSEALRSIRQRARLAQVEEGDISDGTAEQEVTLPWQAQESGRFADTEDQLLPAADLEEMEAFGVTIPRSHGMSTSSGHEGNARAVGQDPAGHSTLQEIHAISTAEQSWLPSGAGARSANDAEAGPSNPLVHVNPSIKKEELDSDRKPTIRRKVQIKREPKEEPTHEREAQGRCLKVEFGASSGSWAARVKCETFQGAPSGHSLAAASQPSFQPAACPGTPDCRERFAGDSSRSNFAIGSSPSTRPVLAPVSELQLEQEQAATVRQEASEGGRRAAGRRCRRERMQEWWVLPCVPRVARSMIRVENPGGLVSDLIMCAMAKLSQKPHKRLILSHDGIPLEKARLLSTLPLGCGTAGDPIVMEPIP